MNVDISVGFGLEEPVVDSGVQLVALEIIGTRPLVGHAVEFDLDISGGFPCVDHYCSFLHVVFEFYAFAWG